MKRFIFRNKNKITLISFILILVGYYGRFFLEGNTLYNTTFIIASIIGVIPIALQAYSSLRVKVVSIDVLVTIAVIGAFVIKEYEESAIVTFLFLFGAYLEAKTLNKTRSAIKELTLMAPETAFKEMENGEVLEVDIYDVDVGDILVVRTGASVPVDGKILSGQGYLNEASITGESLPLDKSDGDYVHAGTILEDGTIRIIAEKVGEDTTFGKIIELVEDAQDSKSAAEKFIDKFSAWYTPTVLILATLVGLIMHFGFNSGNALTTAVTILVLGCPGALVIGVPVSNVASIGNGAKEGVLLKGSEVINDFSRVDTILFDKTGTLTTGKPHVAAAKFYEKDASLAKSYLLSVEKESDHPLARAIVNYLGDIKTYDVTDTKVMRGGGIIATTEGSEVIIGNHALMEQSGISLTDEMLLDIKAYEKAGNSLVLTAVDKKVYSIMGIKDEIRPGIKNDLDQIKKMGVKNLVVLSGDNQGTVDLVASELGLTNAFGSLLPEDKANYIKELQAQGEIVAFVGDGVNDAPSLALADIGIAMGSGTDVAIETSDVVLMNSSMNKLPHALGLTKKTTINMRQNIFIAVGVVIVLLLALIGTSWLTMSIGMLVHQASILVVIFNGMRLSRYRVKNWHWSI